MDSYLTDDSDEIYDETSIEDSHEITNKSQVERSRKQRESDIGFVKRKNTKAIIDSDSEDDNSSPGKAEDDHKEDSNSFSESSLTLHSIQFDESGDPPRSHSSLSNEFKIGDDGVYNSTTVGRPSLGHHLGENILTEDKSHKKIGSDTRSSLRPSVITLGSTLQNSAVEMEEPPSDKPKRATTSSRKSGGEKDRLSTKESFRTPRKVHETSTPQSSANNSEDEDIIEVSSSEEEMLSPKKMLPPPPMTLSAMKPAARQTTLDHLVIRSNAEHQATPKKNPTQMEVSSRQFKDQQTKVKSLEVDLGKVRNILRTVNLDSLPDKGRMLKDRYENLEKTLTSNMEKLQNMVVAKDDTPVPSGHKPKTFAWEEIEAGAGAVLPKTFGKQAMSTYNAQKAITMDRLQQLHGSLKTCPKEDDCAEDPKGLKVDLMPHQKRALAWLMWRENQKPSGGILADDMGLGKTLTMISLMLKTMEIENNDDDLDNDEENQPEKKKLKYTGGTLVVCPASLINQWSGELERRTKRGLASFELYHGPKRETKPKTLSEYDMVITTYAIVNNESDKNGAIFRIKWRRIILDEAHQIRNHKSQTSEAVCQLAGKSRWALTGTPVQNKELDMFALLKFLRCTPFDDLQIWKRWVSDKSAGGQDRLHTVISSLLLRRTKAELMEKGALKGLPERKWELVQIQLTPAESDVYQKVLLFSRTLFAQFLHQRAEKNQDARDNYGTTNSKPNEEYFKMREKILKMKKVKEVSQHEILVLLLRLRQICCHPALIKAMLHDGGEDLGEGDDELDEENLLDQINKLNIDDDEYHPNSPTRNRENGAPVSLKEASKGFLSPSNPIFSINTKSSKITMVLKVLREKVISTNDKAIIVSQWPSYLSLIGTHLRNERVKFDQLDGSVPVNKRMGMVDAFNDPQDDLKVLLLSLTAGGVGLNLVGGNHLFLVDLHWNPQLENQAQDRIYRVGQQKQVFVYKFITADTIEQRIKDLQDKKLGIADSMLSGTKQVIESKLSLKDLRMLFEM